PGYRRRRPGRHRHCRGRPSGPAADLNPWPSLEEKPAPGLEIESSDPGIIIVSDVQAVAGPLSPRFGEAVVGICGPRHLTRDTPLTETPARPRIGEQRASTASSYNPSRDDFATMLDESFAGGNLQESSVIKGTVVAIEKDMAVIDVGLKTEGRVALREFNGPGRENDLKVGDEVEVFLDRIENALGEAVLSRDKARREESWGKDRKSTRLNSSHS